MTKAMLILAATLGPVAFTATAATPTHVVPFDTPAYDTGGYFDPAQPGTFVVPEDVTHVQVGATISQSATTGSSGYEVQVLLDGDPTFTGSCRHAGTTSPDGRARESICSGPIPVEAGQSLQIGLMSTDSSIYILAEGSNFWIRDASTD